MKTLIAGIALLLAAGAASSSALSTSQENPGASDGLQVGVFDSRAVAIAFAPSKFQEEFHQKAKARMDQAKNDGDEKTIAAIEAEMQQLQDEFHQMGFGTASVAGLLEHVADAIPAIAEQAGVDVIVSKWDLVHQRPGTRLVDVTDLIVQPFEPSEETLGFIRQIKNQDPMSPDRARHDH